MPSDWDDDDIVVDDKPREDGLTSDDEATVAPAQAGQSPELESIAIAIPQILQRLDQLALQRTETDHSAEDRVSEAFKDLACRMDTFTDRLDGLEERFADQPVPSTTPPVSDETTRSHEDVETVAATDDVFSETLAQADSRFIQTGEERVFEQLVFGQELCHDHSLDSSRQRLMDGVADGHAASSSRAAPQMRVQTVGVEELPPLLKEIGEAYYCWHPKTTDSEDVLEQSLVNLLEERIAAVGLRNSIEVIMPGDRYDTTRHVSPDRGVEVADVRGWAVLRDNGKPLTKASVGLR